MKSCLLVVVLAGLAALAPLTRAQGPGGLNAGGGVRTGDGIQAVDALGTPLAGEASGGGIQASSGFISGLPIVTPVALRTFNVELTPQGVIVRWEGIEDQRFISFFLERAEGVGTAEPADDAYTAVDQAFRGRGPHEYLDDNVVAGRTYYYRLGWVSPEQTKERVGPWSVFVEQGAGPTAPVIYAAHPNPFHDAFMVSLFLAEPASVGWSIHDLQGRVVAQGGMGRVPSGFYSHRVAPFRPLAAGVYFLRVVTGKTQHVQKIIALP